MIGIICLFVVVLPFFVMKRETSEGGEENIICHDKKNNTALDEMYYDKEQIMCLTSSESLNKNYGSTTFKNEKLTSSDQNTDIIINTSEDQQEDLFSSESEKRGKLKLNKYNDEKIISIIEKNKTSSLTFQRLIYFLKNELSWIEFIFILSISFVPIACFVKILMMKMDQNLNVWLFITSGIGLILTATNLP